ncbi:TniQ family protein [Rhizobium sp. BR 315]|uniref:TniQ family protein n=1 Tax=Rhizobium sp. BR 315 TaxID=3040014 RepID=UPI003D32DD7D
MNRLRGLLTFHTDESIASYCSRIAGALGHVHAQYFCSKQHFSFHGLAVGRPGDFSAFAQLLGVEDVELSSGLIVTEGHWHRLRGQTLDRTLVIRNALRICPHCILDDETRPFGRAGFRAFGRLLWLVEPIRVCERHGTKLVTAPPTSLPIWTHDFWAKLSAIRHELESFASQSRSMRRDDLDTYTTARLSGLPAPSWLNDLPLYVAIHLVEMVGVPIPMKPPHCSEMIAPLDSGMISPPV